MDKDTKVEKTVAVVRKLVKPDGTIAYTRDGKLHSWDHAALIPEGNNKKAEYYLFGIKYTKDEWLDRMKDCDGLPYYKTAAGNAGERN